MSSEIAAFCIFICPLVPLAATLSATREKGPEKTLERNQFAKAMATTGVINLTEIPKLREGFYATNNQFQKTGPKGFIEVKVLANDDLYVRVDMPGVPNDAVQYRIDGVNKKVVLFSGENPDESPDDKRFVEIGRTYSGTAGLSCDCCEITGVNANMENGVLRMILTRVKIKNIESKCTKTVPPPKDGTGRYLEDHPFVVRGPKRAFFAKPTPQGGLYTRMDVPGASADDVKVFICDNEVGFLAESKKASEHDESGRTYLGRFSHSQASAESFDVKWNVFNGVLKIAVPSVAVPGAAAEGPSA